ncbi:peptidoglycan DD-metalloendopeptidase family protein [Oceanobacillus kimchii]|uniref:peptidoglycan DD-metalloendopeptidase family protein n=1 Tax=Oceanobacillus kimchii TaxID=746691 RepID=UPI003C7269AC
MNEEFKGPKNKWRQIFRKKWFFPALYLTIAAVLLTAVVWYQNIDSDTADDKSAEDHYTPVMNDEDAEPVLDQQEVIAMPVANVDEAEIVTKFFDYDADQEDRQNALVLYNNRYYQSTGVDIAAANAETFEVLAAISGTVEEVKEDPLLGNVVVLAHDEDIKTYYASLEEVSVSAGDNLTQGDKLGTAGKNIFGKDNGTHVHFEIRKSGTELNPESYFNQPVSSLANVEEDSAVTEEGETDEASEESSNDVEQEDNAGEQPVEEDVEEDSDSESNTDEEPETEENIEE